MASERGVGYWVIVAYAYILIFWGTLLLARASIHSHPTYRAQTLLLLCGVLAPLATNAVFQLRWSPIPYLDLTPLSFTFAAFVFTWNFYRQGLLFPAMPVARDQVLQSMRDGVIVLDLEHRILDLNQAAQEIVGRDISKVLGRKITNFVLLPEEFSESSEGARIFDGTCRCEGSDDFRHYEVSASPLRTKLAGLVGRALIFRDVSERKRADEQYRRLFTAIEHAAEEVMITDRDAAIVYTNPAFTRITGYSREEVVGKNPRILKSGLHDAAFYAAMWDTLLAGKAWRGIVTNKTKDGSLVQEEATIAPIFGDSEGTSGYVSVKRDVTDQQRLESLLKRAQRLEAVGQFAGGIAHDFNNLLVPIIGYADLLMNSFAPEDPRASDVKEILGAAEHARVLIRQLLAFSRRQVLDLGPVELAQVIKGLMTMLRRTVRESIEFDTDFAPNCGLVQADISQIQQVVMNLVVNAQDAMPDCGRISIHVAEVDSSAVPAQNDMPVTPGRYVKLAVADTGVGMTDDILQRVCEPFFTTKADRGGTGLGLATVHGIVQQHGGILTIVSTPGKGTAVTAYFPVCEDAAPRTLAAESPKERGGTHVGGRVLLVEDNATVRRVVCTLLEESGYEVLPFARGDTCIQAVRENGGGIRLLVTDVVMPDLNGTELYQALRPLLPQLRVLYMSGYADDVLHDFDSTDREVAFIQKPFSHAEFMTKIAALLQNE
jgi:PAS domain S-box-containing protein